MSDKQATNPRGVTVRFYEKEHEYKVGRKKLISATTMLGEFFPKFDADNIAFFVARREGRTKEEVLAEWDKKRDDACDFGNAVHLFAENRLTGRACPKPQTDREKDAFRLVSDFCDKLLDEYDIVEAEKIVFTEEHGISGTIDLVIRHKKTKKISLLDWKTNKKIEKKNGYSKPAYPPIEHLNDANFTKYSLQLNLYKNIMESEGYVDGEIDELILLHIRPKTTKAYYVEDMQKEIEEILSYRLDKKNKLKYNKGKDGTEGVC